MSRYLWSHLNKQQVGAFAEYFVKMELTMHGFEVYTPEVDDRGIDFIARKARGRFLEIQVKSLRDWGYVFMRKENFEIREDMFLALVLLFEGREPKLFLIPAMVWASPDGVFVDRDYEGMKSRPEWGVNVSRKHMPQFERFAFDHMVGTLTGSNVSFEQRLSLPAGGV